MNNLNTTYNDMKKTTEIKKRLKESPSGRIFQKLKTIATSAGKSIDIICDDYSEPTNRFKYDGKDIGIGIKASGEVGDYDIGNIQLVTSLGNLVRVPELKIAIDNLGEKITVGDTVALEHCLEGILGSNYKFSLFNFIVDEGLSDLESIKLIIVNIMKDLSKSFGTDYELSLSSNRSIIIKVLNNEAKEDIINHGDKIHKIMNDINKYFTDNKENIKNIVHTNNSNLNKQEIISDKETIKIINSLRNKF